jgi:hypothetical protein
MKYGPLLLLCAALVGCATGQHHSALQVVRNADPTLAAETTVTGFERRLAFLGATIEGAMTQGTPRSATFLIPASPGYFPPRRVHVVYAVREDGGVHLRSARILSLMIVDHEKA